MHDFLLSFFDNVLDLRDEPVLVHGVHDRPAPDPDLRVGAGVAQEVEHGAAAVVPKHGAVTGGCKQKVHSKLLHQHVKREHINAVQKWDGDFMRLQKTGLCVTRRPKIKVRW